MLRPAPPVLNALTTLERAVSRGRRAHVALEQPREVALVGEARFRRDLRERSVAAGELCGGPLDAQPAAVLADRDPVAVTEGARHLHGRDAELGRELTEPDALAAASPQDLLGRLEPPRRAPRRRCGPPGRGGVELERDAFGGKRSGGVRGAKLPGEPTGEPAQAAAQLHEPVE